MWRLLCCALSYSSSETLPSYRSGTLERQGGYEAFHFSCMHLSFYVQRDLAALSLGTCRDVCTCSAVYRLCTLTPTLMQAVLDQCRAYFAML